MYNIGHKILLYWFHFIRLFFLVMSVGGTCVQNNLVTLNNNKKKTKALACLLFSLFTIDLLYCDGAARIPPHQGNKIYCV